jgi:hypothetical protein
MPFSDFLHVGQTILPSLSNCSFSIDFLLGVLDFIENSSATSESLSNMNIRLFNDMRQLCPIHMNNFIAAGLRRRIVATIRFGDRDFCECTMVFAIVTQWGKPWFRV